MENLEQALGGEKLKGDSDHSKEDSDRRPSTANMAGDKEKEKERKKPARPDQEPFEALEREEMEKLLGELRGHLGERFSKLLACDRLVDTSISRIPDTILGRRGHCEQFPLQCRQTFTATDLQLIFVSHLFIVIHPCNQSFIHSSVQIPPPVFQPSSSCNSSVFFLHVSESLMYITQGRLLHVDSKPGTDESTTTLITETV